MLTNELIARVRRIEITTRQLVEDGLAGEYHSVFKGPGHGVRRGPSVHTRRRRADYRLERHRARTGEPYVKSYVEERELTVMLAVDVSGSEDFGTRNWFKRELAVELAAVVSIAATTNNDKVGLLLFTDKVELLVPPMKGKTHVLRMLRDLLAYEPAGSGTDIRLALDTIYLLLKRRSIVFLVSDFLADPEAYRQAMLVTNRRHDVVAFDISDPLEREIADVGVIALEDAESGHRRWVDTGDRQWRRDFSERVARLDAERSDVFAAAGVDHVRVTTERDYVAEVGGFFKNRLSRLSR